MGKWVRDANCFDLALLHRGDCEARRMPRWRWTSPRRRGVLGGSSQVHMKTKTTGWWSSSEAGAARGVQAAGGFGNYPEDLSGRGNRRDEEPSPPSPPSATFHDGEASTAAHAAVDASRSIPTTAWTSTTPYRPAASPKTRWIHRKNGVQPQGAGQDDNPAEKPPRRGRRSRSPRTARRSCESTWPRSAAMRGKVTPTPTWWPRAARRRTSAATSSGSSRRSTISKATSPATEYLVDPRLAPMPTCRRARPARSSCSSIRSTSRASAPRLPVYPRAAASSSRRTSPTTHPRQSPAGSATMDDANAFLGALDRYDFRLVGKEDSSSIKISRHIVPAATTPRSCRQRISPIGVRSVGDLLRLWWSRRELKPGFRHLDPRRMFDWDEDGYALTGLSENDDAANKSSCITWRGGGRLLTARSERRSGGVWLVTGIFGSPGAGASQVSAETGPLLSPEVLAGELRDRGLPRAAGLNAGSSGA